MSQFNKLDVHQQARSRLIQMFRYVQAFNHLQNPIQQEIQDQLWYVWLHDLARHPCIRIKTYSSNLPNQAANNMAEVDENFAIKVSRPRLTEAPDPPAEIAPWLQNGWQHIDGSVKLDTTRIQAFSEQPKRLQIFDEWLVRRNSWAEAERPARSAMRFYEQLNELRARLERESERLELMIGDGILNWSSKNGAPVHHPILLLRLQLHFNPQIPEFTLQETEHPPELYTALFQTIPDLNPADIGRIRQTFEQNRCYPLDGEETSQFLRQLIHQIALKGEFADKPGPSKNLRVPSITRDPVLFLRNRTQGFSTALEAILEDLPSRNELPSGVSGLIGLVPLPQPATDDIPSPAKHHSPNGEDEQILLSKPANAEQLEIARRLERYGAVLVQGPPGTGKTHTIANLLGHLLAEGKTVLVTSHTSKALRVLREKVVEPLQPLCVSILEDESRKQMESAIDAITERLSFANETTLEQKAAYLTRQRLAMIVQLAQARQELQEARSSEYDAILCAGKQYPPADAARYIKAHPEAAWLPLPIERAAPLPLALHELVHLYRTNTIMTAKDEQQMVPGLPDVNKLLPATEFAQLVMEQARLAQAGLNQRRDLWSNTTKQPLPEVFKGLQTQLAQALEVLRDQAPWRLTVIAAGREGELRRQIWDELIIKIEHAYRIGLEAQRLLLEYDPVLPEDCLPGNQEKVLKEISEYLEKGKKLNNLAYFSHRDWKTLVECALVKGHTPEVRAHFTALHALVSLRAVRNDLAGRWQRQMTALGGPDIRQFGPTPENVCIQYVQQMRQCLEWYPVLWAPLEQQLKQQGLRWEKLLGEMPAQMAEYGDLLRLKEVVQVHLAPLLAAETYRRTYAQNEAKLLELKQQLELSSSSARQTEIVQLLLTAVNRQDAQAYREAVERLIDLYERQKEQQYRASFLARLEKSAPGWARAINGREGIHGHNELPGDPEAAWLWCQLQSELDRRSKISLEDVQECIAKLSTDLQQITIELVEQKAWLAQVRRTTGEQRQALNGWKELMRKVGKGTGKRAGKLLAEARQLMPKCQTAVPVWIMPLSHVVQNFDPRQNRFDVVIIDEASQADIKALAAIYMGKQIVIVGDDEQVTPLAVGQEIDSIEQLIAEHLQGIPLAAMYDGKLSIYQLAKTAPGFEPICLREHFRCVSPIIQFSNNLSYAGKIKPLRDDSDVKRRPPTIAYRVNSSMLTGDVNTEEAVTVASLLVAATEQSEYQDATFGVISLLKEAQALSIDTLLRKYLSPVAYTRHQLLCGIPPQFQGDERDVIFLSMVDIPKDGGPLTLRSEDAYDYMYKKRYNVAASRARDQLWVVHSLDPTSDLKDGDIRKKLLLHAQNPHNSAASEEGQSRKTESEFEKQVLQRLLQAGYRVTPQWPVGAYRIDLVVEGGGKRLAVECDGDRWHPQEKLSEDMARQAILERLGWRFVRIRGSQFFRNPEQAMATVFARLNALEILPEVTSSTVNNVQKDGEELRERIIRRAAELRQQWTVNSFAQRQSPV